MAVLSKKAQSLIEKAVARFKSYIRYKAVGPQALSRDELKELVRSGMITQATRIQAPVNEAYLLTHQVLSTNLPAPRQMRDGALDFLERMMARYQGKLADEMKTDVLSIVEHGIKPFQDRKEGALIYEALQSKDLWKQNLRQVLKGKVENWEYRYKTIVNTEMNRASNWGALDAIVNNNPDLKPEEITVYKQGNKPGAGACESCGHFWYKADGNPRTYKMSELLANGSNIGRKAKDWLPTIDSTHPNCTHILGEIKPGFGFIGGSLEWIGDSHDEHVKQKGPKK